MDRPSPYRLRADSDLYVSWTQGEETAAVKAQQVPAPTKDPKTDQGLLGSTGRLDSWRQSPRREDERCTLR